MFGNPYEQTHGWEKKEFEEKNYNDCHVYYNGRAEELLENTTVCTWHTRHEIWWECMADHVSSFLPAEGNVPLKLLRYVRNGTLLGPYENLKMIDNLMNESRSRIPSVVCL